MEKNTKPTQPIPRPYFASFNLFPLPRQNPLNDGWPRWDTERVQEIEDPELATQRTRAIYKAKGYSDEWIEPRFGSSNGTDALRKAVGAFLRKLGITWPVSLSFLKTRAHSQRSAQMCHFNCRI